MRRLVVVVLCLLAACGRSGGDAGSTGLPSTTKPTDTTAGELIQPPGDLKPGTVDSRTIVLNDGTEIIYGLILPDGFDPSREYPALLALPPGGQDAGLTLTLAESTYAPEALARGWVVITPAAPNGELFFDGSERYLGEFLDRHNWIRPEGGRFHLAGVSNGGISAFRIAALEPQRFASLAVYPGFPRSPADKEALPALVGMPVAMFVGGDDTQWIQPMVVTRDTLAGLGGAVTLEIREGEGHVMASMADGVDLFDFLDSARG
jgi:pimeloyl-ACP methyl ester carboxylesterase